MRLSALFTTICLAVTVAFATVAAAQDAYRVRPGDILRIEVIEDSSLNRSVLVSPDGRISVPLAGSIRASGRSVETVQADLAAALAPNFAATPSVFVAVERLAERLPEAPQLPVEEPMIDIFVIGEVGSAGRIEVSPGATVLQLFATMGGFTNFAATQRIQLRRTDASGAETVYVLDYEAIEAGLSPNGTSTLQDGDVVIVPQRRLFEF